MRVPKFSVGQPTRRMEDIGLLTGDGCYSDDFSYPGEVHAVFVRSAVAHANIEAPDISTALKAPGVLAVLTGQDWVDDGLGELNGTGFFGILNPKRRDGQDWYRPFRLPLASGRVRYLGEPIAVVIAETQNSAKDAAELVNIEYNPLPIVTETAEANEPGTVQIYDDCERNESFVYEVGDKDATDLVFSRAPLVIKQKFIINRLYASPIEPRSALARYDAENGKYEIKVGAQSPNDLRRSFGTMMLRVDPNDILIETGDVGGSFGMKSNNFAEPPVLAWASRKLGRPIKWCATRSESFLADTHGRDNITEGELALDTDGRFLAFRARTNVALGAYMSPAGGVPATLNVGTMAGPYTTPSAHVSVAGVFTNTNPTSAYRGSGRPEAALVIERLIDIAATKLEVDPAQLRRKNMIPADAFPYKTPLVFTYDCGDFKSVLDKCKKAADYDGFKARREKAAGRNRLRGIGIASTIEIAARPGEDTALLQVGADGRACVFAGSTNHGQGHATIYGQILSDELGIPPENVSVSEGNTAFSPNGTGSNSSRSSAFGSASVLDATKNVAKRGLPVAAHLLQSEISDIRFEKGYYYTQRGAATVSFSDVAKAVADPTLSELVGGARLEGTGHAVHEAANFPNCCHICEVEIDPDTGITEIVGYWVVDDVGTELNPAIVKGQVHGGVMQGVGQALMENIVFDEDGQLLTGSYMDYTMPRAADICEVVVDSHPIPTATNPYGAKGVGESGTVASLPATMNAIANALGPIGITHVDTPATPDKIWRLIRDAQR